MTGHERPGAVIIKGDYQGLGLIRSLGRQNIPVRLLDKDICIGRFSRYVRKFSKCPDVKNEAVFLKYLTDMAAEEGLKGWLLYPNDDETVCFLSRHKETLEKYYRVTSPAWDVVKYAYDKTLTYELAGRCGIAVPRTWCPRNIEEVEGLDIEYPVIIKPSVREPFLHRMKKKAIRIDNRRGLLENYARAAQAIENGQTLTIQELIPGGPANLFSVGSLFRDGRLLARVVVRRPRQSPMDFGRSSTFVQTVDLPELEAITTRILGAMGYAGLSEVEFMLDPRDGKYKLLEINARPWGWHTIAISAGVDLPYLSYLDMLGEDIRQNGFKKGIKWMRLSTDIPVVISEALAGRMKISDYINSLRGEKHEAVLSSADPMPFAAEILLLPYLWFKRYF